MRYLLALIVISFSFAGCNDSAETTGASTDSTAATSASTVNPETDWKFGVALWTFHDGNFPSSLARVDSAGIRFIEPNTFHQAGPELKDTLVGKLSAAGLEKLKSMIAAKRLTCESVYVVGDSTAASWVRQFEIAKTLGAKFITTEPPLKLWDLVDSIAGVYGIRVAIHEHWKGVSDYWNPDTTLAALKGHPNFGVCADLGHFPKSGIDPLDAVKKFNGHIIGIHLKDIAAFNDPALKDVRAGTGVVNFPAIFQELKRQNFKGHIYMERDSIEPGGNVVSAQQTVKYYNDQIRALK